MFVIFLLCSVSLLAQEGNDPKSATTQLVNTKDTSLTHISGFFSPVGTPSTPPKRIDVGGSCIVDLEQDYKVSGSLSGKFTIDYRIMVKGSCGSPLGTFDEDWIAYGTFSEPPR